MGPLWPARRIPADERNYSTRKPATTCESQVNALVVRDVVLEFFGQFSKTYLQDVVREDLLAFIRKIPGQLTDQLDAARISDEERHI